MPEIANGKPRRRLARVPLPVALTSQAWRVQQDRLPALILLAALLSASLVGAALAHSIPLGAALLIAVMYAPLVLINLPLGVVAFIPIVFFTGVPVFKYGPTLAGILIFLAWFGALLGHSSEGIRMIREQRRYLVLAGLLLLWVNLSLAWSREPASGSDFHFGWIQGAALYLVIVTTLVTRRLVQLAAGALVLGAVASVVAGLTGGLESSQSAIELASNAGRIGGGAGDPNYLAAGLIPNRARGRARLRTPDDARTCRVRVGGAHSRRWVRRRRVSRRPRRRGGRDRQRDRLLQARTTAGARRAAGRGRRRGGVVLSQPRRLAADQRLRLVGNGPDGAVGNRLADGADHPVVGVGLQNFIVESPAYVDRSGPLEFVRYIAEQPLVAHNVYVQLFAELGVIGLGLYLGLVITSLRAAVLAARRFEARGDRYMATLARAALVAGLATMAASFFISDAHERRNWVTYALGPTLLAVSARRATDGDGDAERRPHIRRA